MNQLSLDLETSDEDFFGTLESNKSNLSKLFGIATNLQQKNPTLKYQAPSASTTSSEQNVATAGAQSWNVQLAKVVRAYKDSTPVGKVGVALLRNIDEESKIILYKTKTNVLATLTLTLEMTPAIYRRTPYLQFYDDVQGYWSLLFDKEIDEAQFVGKLYEFNVKINELELEQENEKLAEQLVQQVDEVDKTKIEEVTSEHSSKATLVSRMAKMGQKLPIFTSNSTEYSDSSDTEVISTPLAISHKPAVAPRNNKTQRTHIDPATSCVSVYNGSNNFPLQLQETQFMHMLLTENRTQNTEVRMNMNKLESKIEKVLDKMDLMGTSNANHNNKEDEILELEEKLLELKKENRKLKQALDGGRKSQAEATSYEKFSTLYAMDLDNLRIVSPNWETLGTTLIERVKNLQAEYLRVQAETTRLTNEIQVKTKEQLEQNSILSETQLNLKTMENELKNAKAELEMQQHTIEKCQKKLQMVEQTHSEEHNRQTSEMQATVKDIMNNLYRNIAEKLDKIPNGSLGNEQILALVGKAIRNETLQTMQKTS